MLTASPGKTLTKGCALHFALSLPAQPLEQGKEHYGLLELLLGILGLRDPQGDCGEEPESRDCLQAGPTPYPGIFYLVSNPTKPSMGMAERGGGGIIPSAVLPLLSHLSCL